MPDAVAVAQRHSITAFFAILCDCCIITFSHTHLYYVITIILITHYVSLLLSLSVRFYFIFFYLIIICTYRADSVEWIPREFDHHFCQFSVHNWKVVSLQWHSCWPSKCHDVWVADIQAALAQVAAPIQYLRL